MDKHWSKYQNRYGYYEGEMKNGQRNGVGRFVYSEGGECFGTWGNDILTYGKGTLWFVIKIGQIEYNGKYVGDIKNDKAEGQGKFYNFDCAGNMNYVYSGGFKNGVFHGRGTITYWNGTSTTEVWENGKSKSLLIDKADNNTQSEGCYIATCVYGDYDCPQVMFLRKYRDEKLKTNLFGRIFIKCYYAISPKLVKIIKNNNKIKNIWKKCLDRIINNLKKAERN